MKKRLLPYVNDFSDPQNHIRNKPIKDLRFTEYIWFRNEALHLLWISVPLVILLSNIAVSTWLFLTWGWDVIVVIVISHWYDKRFIKMFLKYFEIAKGNHELTFYDMFMLER